MWLTSSAFEVNIYIFRGGNSIKIDLLPSEKRTVVNGKEYAPCSSKLFPLKADPFSESRKADRKLNGYI